MKISKLTSAYLAGLVDGEGYIGILQCKQGNKSKWTTTRPIHHIPVIKIASTNREIIQWLHDSYGGSQETRKAFKNNKESYCWTMRKDSVRDFISHVHPYLRIKNEQANIILRFPRGKAGHPIDDAIYAKRIELCDRIHELNKRGAA